MKVGNAALEIYGQEDAVYETKYKRDGMPLMVSFP